MGTATDKFRVLIPTTNGPVEVLLLTEEDAAIGRCVACIGGTTETADIATAYHAFVVRPTGVIESLFGHSCYRLDVSGRIDAGSSWQLGVLAAHALHAAGRLAGERDRHDGVVWATGSVRPVDLTVGSVGHIPEKLTNSIDGLKREAAAGRRVVLALPEQNASELSAAQSADLAAHGIEVITPAHVQALFDALSMKLPEGPQRMPAKPAAPRAGVSPPARRRMPLFFAAAAAIFLCVGATTLYVLERAPAPVEKATQASPPAAPTLTEVKQARRLVPELVPLISEHDQVLIRDVYLPAPDYKALAVESDLMAFVTGQADQDSANKVALAACEKKSKARSGLVGDAMGCDLYASGTTVVTSRGDPPMPPEPWVVRDPSIERPFVAADLPLLSEATKKQQAEYLSVSKPKALAVGPTGRADSFSGYSNTEEVSRYALQRCGYAVGAPCMIVALDDVFVVPIPRLAKVVGFFRPEALTAVAPELRESVVRRLGNSRSGWNAVAIGASGQVGLELGAASEQTAIDGSLTACGRQDHDCRLAVLGPFMVEREPAKSPAAAATSSPPAPAPTAVKQTRRLVPELVPLISDHDQALIRDVYLPAPDYKALAVDSFFMAFVTGQADQAIADKAAVVACEKNRSARHEPPGSCELYASGATVVTSRGDPPMPPQPWVVRDPSIERPFVAAEIPLLTEASKRFEEQYPSLDKSKALALSPAQRANSYYRDTSVEQASRRALQQCGYDGGVACMIIAIDDVFVVPIPRLAKVVGFYRPGALTAVAPELREGVVQRLGNSRSGWNAVAIGASGQVGLELGAASEQAAIDGSMTSCSAQDHDCRIAVLGPFMVEPGPAKSPTASAGSSPPAAPAPPAPLTEVKQAKRLAPELVPLIAPGDEAKIRDVYMLAPDYKALALSAAGLTAFVTAQADQDAADKAALAACEKMGKPGDPPLVCDLYASGTTVVSSRGDPPMPPQPWAVVRDPSIERPFVAADLPLLNEASKKGQEQYSSLGNSKAFALGPTGRTSVYYRYQGSERVSRNALQRCGYDGGVACMIVALDDVFVVPIPKLVKVVGFFQPQALTAIAPELRDDVARQLAGSRSGWNVVAIGAGGQAGLALGAASEQAAIDEAMAACDKQDHDCHVTVVGPFLTYREAPKARSDDQTEPAGSKLLVPDLVPFISDADQAVIRDVYLPASDYKALVLGINFDIFITGQASQETADAAALSACQKQSALRLARGQQSIITCDLYASGNVVVTSRGHPPMPPRPWLVHDPSIERPFVAADLPLVSSISKVVEDYPSYPKSKALALAPTGRVQIYNGDSSPEQVARRTLERCGFDADSVCMLIAVDDMFIVPIPRLAKVVGFFHPQSLTAIAPGLREDVVRRLGSSRTGWNAVAIGASGQAGLELGAASEQAAVDGSMTACSRQDHDCRIAVLGPFMVEPKPPKPPNAGGASATIP